MIEDLTGMGTEFLPFGFKFQAILQPVASSLLKKAFRQPEPSKTAVFLEVDSSENGLFNRLLENSPTLWTVPNGSDGWFSSGIVGWLGVQRRCCEAIRTVASNQASSWYRVCLG
jgi:hypothetical protein